MPEYKFFDGDEAYVSTFAFHEHRERAPHLEQEVHQARLKIAAEFAVLAFERHQQFGPVNHALTRLIDLGCGDGGLLSLLKNYAGLVATGYDFAPANVAGWEERGVDAEALNFVKEWPVVPYADVYVMTEVLEHLTDPHQMVRRVKSRGAQLVASSPRYETFASHDECHAWGWDMEGYAAMVTQEGLRIKEHVGTGLFQVLWAVSR